jgi:hypothetical protein
VTPLIIVGVVVAYLASEALTAYVDSRIGSARGAQTPPVPAEQPATA